MLKKSIISFLLFFLVLNSAVAREINTYKPPFKHEKQPQSIPFKPLLSVSKPWKICAVYPHLKDSYWLSINYGMVEQAKTLGITLKVLEAGGYPELEKQKGQLQYCKQWGADAIILGTVDRTAYNGILSQFTGDIPVFSMTNDIDMTDPDIKKHIKAKVGVDWYYMGKQAGVFLAQRHPKGSRKVKVAWLPGPKQRGGTKPVNSGFLDALQNSDIEVVSTLWADNSKELQRNLIQQLFTEHPDIDYIVGGAVAAEVAISELRTNHRTEDVKIISTYLSHGVYRGLRRGKILFSPTDKMAQQAQMSIDQAVRYLENKPMEFDLAPKIQPLTPEHLPKEVITDSLSPAEYRPVFNVENHDVAH